LARITSVAAIIILHDPQRFTYEMNFHKGERMLIGDPLLRCCVFYQKIAATEVILANFQKYCFLRNGGAAWGWHDSL
jgi:hypothetical protein